MKVIFLDLDGVLNSDRTIYALPMQKIPGAAYAESFLKSKCDPIAVAILNRIIRDTGAKIVISSSNRIILGFDGCQRVLSEMGVIGDVIGVTDRLLACRGAEIQKWLDENEVEEYVIVDDSCDMLESQMKNFVRVTGQVGLSFSDAVEIKKILGVATSPIIMV